MQFWRPLFTVDVLREAIGWQVFVDLRMADNTWPSNAITANDAQSYQPQADRGWRRPYGNLTRLATRNTAKFL